jgi:uncharacterized SAM-binding protein YcdF (DUF218 family)
MKISVPLLCRIVLAGLMFLIVGYVIVAWQIVQFGNQTSDASADAAVVLGAAAWGNKPSPVYRERLNEAISLYKQGRVRWIIFTGGTPRPEYPSEAEVGRQFSARYEIPLSAMIVDVESRNTWQNLERAKALMDRAGIRSMLLVSDPLHMRRAMAMATDLGLQAKPAPTLSSRFRSWPTWGRFLWRETWLYIDYRVFGRLSETAVSVDSAP